MRKGAGKISFVPPKKRLEKTRGGADERKKTAKTSKRHPTRKRGDRKVDEGFILGKGEQGGDGGRPRNENPPDMTLVGRVKKRGVSSQARPLYQKEARGKKGCGKTTLRIYFKQYFRSAEKKGPSCSKVSPPQKKQGPGASDWEGKMKELL